MSRQSRKYKKQFDCGHKGYGQYCHRCEGVKSQQITSPSRQESTYPFYSKLKTEASTGSANLKLKTQRKDAINRLSPRGNLLKTQNSNLKPSKDQWQQSFLQDCIDLSYLPKRVFEKL
ncbi:MAG: hypothetical protein SFY66_14900 [Oculatellaceae cyanobacterium bins.114]|nr:hypothetical protein [Oculatellaceae cyanobacterium bins.114]